MQIEQKNINEIKPYERNPRINDNAIDAVVASLKEFGFRQPIVIDAEGVIICGHSRWIAAKKMGLTEIPVHIARDLTPEQIKAYRIADNKTAELAEWDLDLLPLELIDLQDNGYDLSLLGFDNTELENLLLGDDEPTQGMTNPDEVPELPEEAKSQRGEIYQLGNHFLMCGDSTKPDDVETLMQEKKADFWLTDPPYNVNYEGSSGLKIENDNMEDLQFRKFLVEAFQVVHDVLKPGSTFYIFHADSEGYNFRGACHDIGLKVRQLSEIPYHLFEIRWCDAMTVDSGIMGAYVPWLGRKVFLMPSEPPLIKNMPDPWPEQIAPTLIHELRHAWQYQKYKLLYVLCCLPIVRQLTLERDAWKITEKAEKFFSDYEKNRCAANIKKVFKFKEN